MLKDKKNIPIIISVSLCALILIAGLFWIVYFKKGDFFLHIEQSKDSSLADEDKERIKKQIAELNRLRKEYNIPEPTSELIQKQKEEMIQISKELSIPKPTPELIQKQKEEMEKIRQRIMP